MSLDSISSISSSQSYSSCSQNNNLSEETKRKLQALGIDPTSVSSEAQAQMLIIAAQRTQQTSQNQNQQSQSQAPSTTSEVMSKIKTLASNVGVSTSTNDTIDEIASKITSKLNQMAISAKGDEAKTNQIQQYQSELQAISQEGQNISSSQNSMYAAMNMTANMNKMLLGLS